MELDDFLELQYKLINELTKDVVRHTSKGGRLMMNNLRKDVKTLIKVLESILERTK